MKKNLTEIIFIIDQSGSMQPFVEDTIGGFNGFIENQKRIEGEAYLTTVLFSASHHKLHDHVDIREVEEMDRKQYLVGGSTAMLDAIGDTISEVQKRIDNTAEADRPEHVLCAITTDGMENASLRYRKSNIQQMIEHQTKGHGWQFIFLGANMDAVQEASNIGVTYAATYTADSVGTRSVYDAVNCAAKSVRTDGVVDAAWCNAVNTYTEQAKTTLF